MPSKSHDFQLGAEPSHAFDSNGTRLSRPDRIDILQKFNPEGWAVILQSYNKDIIEGMCHENHR